MATLKTGKQRAAATGSLNVAVIDSYIALIKALVKVVCKSPIRWTVTSGIRVTKGCPMPTGIRVTKGCPMPTGIRVTRGCPMPDRDGSVDLCEALKSLLAMLQELRAAVVRGSATSRRG